MVVQRMNRPASRAVAIGVAAAMACATLVAVPHMAQAQPEAQTNAKKDVQVIAFQQTWNTVAKECTSTYGPEGVAYVEVSPPQESIQGTQWWTSYQPVSYKLDSKLGTEAEFKNMIKQCNAVGVAIALVKRKIEKTQFIRCTPCKLPIIVGSLVAVEFFVQRKVDSDER